MEKLEGRSSGSMADKIKIHCLHLQISSRIDKKKTHYFKNFSCFSFLRSRTFSLCYHVGLGISLLNSLIPFSGKKVSISKSLKILKKI